MTQFTQEVGYIHDNTRGSPQPLVYGLNIHKGPEVRPIRPYPREFMEIVCRSTVLEFNHRHRQFF